MLIVILSFATPMVFAISDQSTQNGTTEEHTIIGYKYYDLNGNGVRDPGEPGIPGVTIQLFIGDKLVATTTTNSSGYYNFRHLGVDNYTVNEIVPAGHINTSPSTVLATIDPNTDTVTVNFGDIAKAAKVAYVANNADNNISVIDLTTNSVINTIPDGVGPHYMAVTPDNTRLYVDHCCGRNYVWVIDTVTNQLIANITLPSGTQLDGIAITPDGTKAYITGYQHLGPRHIFVVDTLTNTVIDTIRLPREDVPVQIAINPAGTRAYVTLGGFDGVATPSNRVAVINTVTNRIIRIMPVGNQPYGIAISPDGTQAYVTDYSGGFVSMIDTATNTVIGPPIPVGNNPDYVAFTPNGARAYVTNLNPLDVGTVSVIDTATKTVIDTIPVGAFPFGVAITPDGTRAYVTNEGSANVSVIDTATNKVIDTIPVGNDPQGIAILS